MALTRLRPLPLRPLLVALTLVLGLCAALLGPQAPAAAAARGDDYPYRADTTWAADPWGFTKRQCVSFTAFRLAQHGVRLKNSTQRWGSAYTWNNAARRLGHRVDKRPAVGAVAQWNEHERSAYYGPGSTRPNGSFTAGPHGHVAWVKAVYRDGSVLLEQYNLGSDRAYSTMRAKAPRYLHLGAR